MMIKVPHLWCPPTELSRAAIQEIYQSCERKSAARCIESQRTKVTAKHLGRGIRKANTLKGFVNWSEFVDGSWHMFRAPLKLSYAKAIDKYDAGAKKFDLPKRLSSAFGPVEWKGECVERRDDLDVIRARKATYGARVAKGEVKPRSKFREPQAPMVLERLAAA